MKTSETILNLSKALAAAQGEMVNPESTEHVQVHAKKSDGGGLLYEYWYAPLPKCFDAGRMPLAKHGISHTAVVTLGTGGLLLTVRVTHESGEWMESEMPLPPGLSSKDRAGEITFWKRYLFNGLVGIAGDDDVRDENGDRGPSRQEPKPARERSSQGRSQTAQPPQGAAKSAAPAAAAPSGSPADMEALRIAISERLLVMGWAIPHLMAYVKERYKVDDPLKLTFGQLKNLQQNLEKSPAKPAVDAEEPPHDITPPADIAKGGGAGGNHPSFQAE